MNGRLTSREIEELLGAYALDAGDADEREQIEDALRDHPEWRDEVTAHLEVAALLAHTGAPAPEGLWDRIAGALEEAPPALRLAVLPPADLPPADRAPEVARLEERRRRSRVPVVLGAVAATVIVFLGVVVVRQEQRLDRQEEELLAPTVDELASSALADPDSAEAILESEDGSLAAKAVVAPDGSGYLLGGELPELPADRTYQLWGITNAGTIVSLGVFGPTPQTSTFHVDGEVTTLALTDEVEGGVVSSEQTPVVVGSLA